MPTITKPGTTHTEQNILNWSFDDDYNVLAIGVLGSDGTSLYYLKVNAQGELVVDTGGGELAVNIQVNSGDANIKYVGQAAIGTATSVAEWQIMKIDKTTGTVITYADGNDSFDNEFDDRESLSYS